MPDIVTPGDVGLLVVRHGDNVHDPLPRVHVGNRRTPMLNLSHVAVLHSRTGELTHRRGLRQRFLPGRRFRFFVAGGERVAGGACPAPLPSWAAVDLASLQRHGQSPPVRAIGASVPTSRSMVRISSGVIAPIATNFSYAAARSGNVGRVYSSLFNSTDCPRGSAHPDNAVITWTMRGLRPDRS